MLYGVLLLNYYRFILFVNGQKRKCSAYGFFPVSGMHLSYDDTHAYFKACITQTGYFSNKLYEGSGRNGLVILHAA